MRAAALAPRRSLPSRPHAKAPHLSDTVSRSQRCHKAKAHPATGARRTPRLFPSGPWRGPAAADWHDTSWTTLRVSARRGCWTLRQVRKPNRLLRRGKTDRRRLHSSPSSERNRKGTPHCSAPAAAAEGPTRRRGSAAHSLCCPSDDGAVHAFSLLSTGSGLCALAALRAGALSVTATDIDPLAVEAISLNAAANGAAGSARGQEKVSSSSPAARPSTAARRLSSRLNLSACRVLPAGFEGSDRLEATTTDYLSASSGARLFSCSHACTQARRAA